MSDNSLAPPRASLSSSLLTPQPSSSSPDHRTPYTSLVLFWITLYVRQGRSDCCFGLGEFMHKLWTFGKDPVNPFWLTRCAHNVDDFRVGWFLFLIMASYYKLLFVRRQAAALFLCKYARLIYNEIFGIWLGASQAFYPVPNSEEIMKNFRNKKIDPRLLWWLLCGAKEQISWSL